MHSFAAQAFLERKKKCNCYDCTRMLHINVLDCGLYLFGFAKRYIQDFLATVSYDACSVLDHSFYVFLMIFSVQKVPNKLQ